MGKTFRTFFTIALAGGAAITTAAWYAGPVRADAYVASWNIKRLGHGDSKDYAALAEVGARFDLIAAQEVMTEDGAERMLAALEARTGADWELMLSDAIGRGSYKEMYGFFWRTDEVEWVDGAIVYIDDRDVFAREPFSARFRAIEDDYTFVLGSVHIIYGDSVAERETEVAALRSYRDWLDETFRGSDVYIAGDFNLPPDNEAWAGMGALAAPLITSGATTLSETDGRFANLYDNIWVPTGGILPIAGAGILGFANETLGISHSVARDTVSDHAPVWMKIDAAAKGIEFEGRPAAMIASGASTEKVATPAASPAIGGEIQGNRNSKIYHLPGCASYDKTAERNRVLFTTEAEAAAAGFRRARNC